MGTSGGYAGFMKGKKMEDECCVASEKEQKNLQMRCRLFLFEKEGVEHQELIEEDWHFSAFALRVYILREFRQ